MRIVFLGLGSNRGNRREHIERALDEIARRAVVLAVSSYYRTDPVGFADQPAFLNAVAAIAWKGPATRLLREVQAIERIVGRTPSFRNGPREIDVDILDFEGVRRGSRDPLLPHPRMARRRFVLAPLAEIAPGWRHPENGRTAAQMMRGLPARPGVRRLSSRPRGFSAPGPGY